MLDQRPLKPSSTNTFSFLQRHIGISSGDEEIILDKLDKLDLEDFISSVVPNDILDKYDENSSLFEGCSEQDALNELREIAEKNQIKRSLIGLGYYGTSTPAVIQRNVLENPSWYTAYTPYQAEISQGRLEALFNFQTFISELTGLPIANASLLDEATAAAEAMSVCFALKKNSDAKTFLVDKDTFPQTLAVLNTRAEPLGISIELFSEENFFCNDDVFGVFIQLPGCSGRFWDPSLLIDAAHKNGALVTVSIDPLAQVLIAPIAEFGADIAVGSAQRLGVPLGFGGPHAAFFATKESYKRQIPGRIVGQSVDLDGKPALRLALQTREQHIRRDKATSNICTAQVLLAVISSFYAIHHGPEGLRNIALKIINYREQIEKRLVELGYPVETCNRFDTIEIYCEIAPLVHKLAAGINVNLRVLPIGSTQDQSKGFGITFDELTTDKEIQEITDILENAIGTQINKNNNCKSYNIDEILNELPLRNYLWMQQEVFHNYRSETELMRYMHTLVSKDFSLVDGMIPLGSCTMKLNAASELIPISWRKFSSVHPYAPSEQCNGYKKLSADLEEWLASLTGFSGVSLQPNAGSQGEFAGLLVIRAWHKSRDEDYRNICLIPKSAHGTNPASAVMAGLKVVPIDCDEYGNIDFGDLENKAQKYSKNLSTLMVTYPSTHGVFEPNIRDICGIVHSNGGQVYLDGANLNAQVGLCRPGNYGADVCHLNLHKTFCIPHGGGGPGVGPIAVASHLLPFLPKHPLSNDDNNKGIGSISAAPLGSAGILPISWMYLRMMGKSGLRKASSIAMLSANYLAYRLNPYYPVLFKGVNGFVAHECILDLRDLKRNTGIEVDDIAKRLMDYGFHAPTVSWPVAGTMMVEPTESESLQELNRFCDAMIAIRSEIEEIELGKSDSRNNPLVGAPHTLLAVTGDNWDKPYSRSKAAFPLPDQRYRKFWPSVSRIDNAYGDRNLVCSCLSFDSDMHQEKS